MNQKAVTIFKYSAVYILGFLTNFSGFLDNITSIPNSYSEFKKVYLFDEDLLKGQWSTNTEYLMNSGDMGLDIDQPVIIMSLEVTSDGETNGEILSKRVCDALPLTWAISMESPAPNLTSLFIDRTFYIKQLHNGSMESVVKLKLVDEDKKNKTLKFQRVDDKLGLVPEFILFGKSLPAFDSDYEALTKYCADSPKRFREKIKSLQTSS